MLPYGREKANRFMQGTLENAILAGADMMKGDGMKDALLQQNREKTQYRAADSISYCRVYSIYSVNVNFPPK